MPTSPELLTEFNQRHQVMLERNKSHEVKAFEKYLVKMAKVVRGKLEGEDLTEFSRARLEKLIVEIDRSLNTIFTDYKVEWRGQVVDLAKYEADFEIKSLNQVVDYNFAVPSASQLDQAVFGNPLSAKGYEGYLLDPFFDNELTKKSIDRISGAIRAGQFQGLTTPQIIQGLIGTKKANYTDGIVSLSYRDASTITRTALQHSAMQARQKTWEQNSDIIKGWIFRATLDFRTSQQCRSLDGTKWPIGKGPQPPIHPNACLKDTLITTIFGQKKIQDVCVGDLVLTHTGSWKRVTTVMARNHNGMARDLIDNYGRSVSLTNEHPVLTLSKGWVEASDIQRGDILFNNTKKLNWLQCFKVGSKIDHRILINSYNIITKLTEELVSYGIFSGSAGMSSAIKLNHCVSDNEIGVINKNSLLKNILSFNAIQKVNKYFLMASCFCCKNFLHCIAHFYERFMVMNRVFNLHSSRAFSSTLSHKSWVGFAPMFVSGRLWNIFHIINNRLPFVFGFNSIPNAEFTNSIVAKPSFALNKAKAFATSVMLYIDNIFNRFIVHNNSKWFTTTCTEIVEYHYSGYVYNLSVCDDETYIANGILVHNCRSSMIAELDDRFNFLREDATRSTRGQDGVQSVSANTTYYEWLKTQPANFQDAAIGATRGKLLREGGLSAERFAELGIGKTFEPLRLDQMRELDPVAFDRAGL